MKYRLSKRALTDIESIGLYIARDSASAADRVVDSIFERLKMLERFPRAGRRREDLGGGYRSVSVGQSAVLYKIGDTTIQVARVLHGKRDLPKIIKREDL